MRRLIGILDKLSTTSVNVATGVMIVGLLALSYHIAMNNDFVFPYWIKFSLVIFAMLYVLYLIGKGFHQDGSK